MVRAVAVDYGGVLVDLPSEAGNVERIASAVGLSAAELRRGVFGEGRALWNRTKVGVISEAEHWAAAGKVLGSPAGQVDWIKRQLFDAVTVRAEFVRYLQGLKGKCRLALVSNAIPSFTDTWRRLGLLELFDVAINSSEVGVAKPDPRIFELTALRLGVRPDECVFVDDQQENVDAAASLGFLAVRYVDAAQAVQAIHRWLQTF